ncbi:MAG: potassium transporter TrkG [Pseudomonadota bacterium]
MIQFLIIRRLIGAMLMIFGASMLPPLAVSLIYADGKWTVFFALMLLTLAIGFLLFRNTPHQREPKTRDGIVIVVLIWLGFSLIGSLPFVWGLGLSFTDAVFEAVSGLTTTGATVLSGLDSMAKSILWYRMQLHFFGGMGVIILAVAILPMFNVGGARLFKSEATGVNKEDKLAPRIAQTARLLWLVYVCLIGATAFAFWLAGMTVFDAICHAISAVATGGFGNYDASLGYYDSDAIHLIAMVAMLAGAVNMGLHFAVWHRKDVAMYGRDQETRTFLGIVLFVAIVASAVLIANSTYPSLWQTVKVALFHVISVITSSGYTIADMSVWPMFVPLFVIACSYFGGCSGSTAGGIKILRVFLLFKQASREAKRLVQPGIVAHVKYNGRIVPEGVADSVWGFFALWILTAAMLTLLLVGTGLSPVGAFGAAAAALNNMGVGLAEVGTTFAGVSTAGKWLLSFAMLLGRLEIFTFFVLFTPIFWRRF